MNGGQRSRLLLVGPRCIDGDVVGGTKVSFENLITDLREDGRFELRIVDTSRPYARHPRTPRRLLDLWVLLRTLASILVHGFGSKAVAFNVSARGCLGSGPLIYGLTRLQRTPLCVRVFGGDLDLGYERAPGWKQSLARATFLRSPWLLLQTHALCAAFGEHGSSRWFPTTRDLEAPAGPAQGPCRKFVYIGQLRPEKGLAEVLAAAEALPESCQVDLYGPPMPDTDVAALEHHPRARWHGPLDPERVPAVLAEHDALLFPTYYEGEGMPGIVVEALQLGKPVLCSDWRALPELVRDGVNGLHVSPRSKSSLAFAMKRLADDPTLYRELSAGALATGATLRRTDWHRRLGDWLLGSDSSADSNPEEAPRCAA